MSASAKPTEKLFKSFLAAVLAISLCPLMPADKAQAEEAGDLSEPTDAAQVSDEGSGGDADPTEGALAADNSNAELEPAEENNGAEDEGATDDSNVALQAASDSGTPIVNWTECGTCQWMIDSNGCLIIEPQSGESGELEDWGWTAPWSNYKNSIISVTINKTVIAKTASSAFYDCKSLRSVDLSGLDTSSVTGMSYMFYNCSSLAALDLSSFDTSQVLYMSSMFKGCSKLSSLDLSSFDTSKVTDMSDMFYGCSSLKSLNVTSFDTCKVTSMLAMFNSCTSLESLDLSSFNASSVTTMMVMFGNCPSLKSLTFPSRLDTSNVKSMRLLFAGCKALNALDISGFNTSKVTDMSGMFSNCTSLASLDVSSLDTSKVTDMSGMFRNCPIQTLELSNFETSQVTNASSMFSGCASLESLNLSGFDTSNVTNASNMFSGCSSLVSLDLSSFDTSKVTDMSDMFYGCSSLKSLNVTSFDTCKVTSMLAMFNSCTSLESLDLSSFNASSVTTMMVMFGNCPSLKSLTFPSRLDTSNVKSMRLLFAGCKALNALDISGFNTSKVTDMSGMFSNCTSLASLDVSSLDTSKVTDMSGMFRNCPIQTLELSNFETSQVTNASSMFSGCASLESLDLSGFATPKVADMSSMFDGCTSLASLDISHFDTSSASNMANMFWNCSSLRSVALGEKFSFRGAKNARQCSLPKLKGDGLTGFWENVETHELYAEDEIPNNVAATYIAQVKSEIPKTSISESMFVVDTRAKTYTGLPIKPSVSSDTLNKGTDYDVSYGENMNAGEGTVVITGTGDYVGQVTYAFRIDPKQVDAPKAAADLVYSGAEQVGVAPSDDYEVAGGSATNAGDYTAAASLKDKKNYVWAGKDGFDDVRVPWSIAKAVPSYSAPEPVDATLGQTLGGLELPGGFSWQDDPSTSVGNAGEHEFMAKFTPSDAANYNVVQNIPVIVRVSSPNLVAVPQVADLVYTGEFQKAVVPESDFYAIEEVRGGIDAGAYEVKLSLKDSSSCRWADDGSNSEKTVTYRILPAQLTDVMITGVPARMEATGSQLTPKPIVSFNGNALTQGTDYSLSYGENVNPGKGTVTVTAIENSNFTGSATVEFDIEKKAEPAPVFSDVDYSDSSWYGDAVSYVASRGLITGYTDGVKAGQFGVGDVLTRAQLATILWRNACPDEYASYDPETAKDTTGIDGSADGMYYTAAANWAVRNGVITGFDREDGSRDFAADDDVSFEQLVTILARLCATSGELDAAGTDLSAFADGDLASSWSRGAFAWAAAKGLVQGYDEPTGRYLRPGDPVARERVAVVLMRAFEMGIMK